MNHVIKKLSVMFFLLLLALFTFVVVSECAQAADRSEGGLAEEQEIGSDDGSSRSNITYLEGEAGDPYLVYTYEEDGRTYKVIDEATEDFSTVESQIFVQNESGLFERISEQRVETLPSGDVICTVSDETGTWTETLYDASQEEAASI